MEKTMLKHTMVDINDAITLIGEKDDNAINAMWESNHWADKIDLGTLISTWSVWVSFTAWHDAAEHYLNPKHII